jgi:photosystem II stability/assembly factor-like uncharacterized protein
MKKKFYLTILLFGTILFNLLDCNKIVSNTETFTETKIFETAGTTDISFITKDIGFISGSTEWSISTAVIAKTIDGGNSWNVIPVVMDVGNATVIRSIYGLNKDTIYATYSTVSGQGVCFSKDGGESWSNLSSFCQRIGFTGILFKNSQTGFVCGGGDILKTINGGSSWSTVFDHDGIGGIGDLFFTSKNIGYGYGSYFSGGAPIGTLVRTEDAGDSWTKISSLTEATNCVQFINDTVGYAFTYQNNIFKTINGGISWKLISNVSNIGGAIYYAAAVSGPEKYFSTGSSIFKTSDDFKKSIKIYSSLSGDSELSIKDVQPDKETIYILSSQHSVIKILINSPS